MYAMHESVPEEWFNAILIHVSVLLRERNIKFPPRLCLCTVHHVYDTLNAERTRTTYINMIGNHQTYAVCVCSADESVEFIDLHFHCHQKVVAILFVYVKRMCWHKKRDGMKWTDLQIPFWSELWLIVCGKRTNRLIRHCDSLATLRIVSFRSENTIENEWRRWRRSRRWHFIENNLDWFQVTAKQSIQFQNQFIVLTSVRPNTLINEIQFESKYERQITTKSINFHMCTKELIIQTENGTASCTKIYLHVTFITLLRQCQIRTTHERWDNRLRNFDQIRREQIDNVLVVVSRDMVAAPADGLSNAHASRMGANHMGSPTNRYRWE